MFSYGFPKHWSTLKKLLWLKILQGAAAVVETVTGTLPLTLANAINHAIVSLTRYGLCTQASTPAGSFVPIKCNNGELRMVDDELPSGYKRVLGFQCNNNAMWQIADFHLRGSDTVRTSFSVSAACNVFGCYQGTDALDNYDLYVSTTSGSKYLRYGNGTYLSYWSAANLDQRFDVVFTPTGTTGMPQDSTWTEATFESANDLLIGATTLTGTSAKLKGNLYGNFEVDGRLKLIPCERLSDGVLGYYDTYTNTFYEPYTGFEGAVSLGYDGSHYVLRTVGTPEVLTVGGKNLLNTATNITGKYITASGSISNGDDAQYSDLIPVTAGATYTWSLVSNRPNGGNNRWHGYDSAGNWVQQIKWGSPGQGIGLPFSLTATIPNGISYVRISYGIDDTEVMFEEGATATDYQPYIEPQTASAENLYSVGDTKDTQEIISGLVDSKIDFAILDGTEDGYGASSAYGAAVYISSASTKWKANRNGGVLCTHFAQGTASGTQPENTCFFNASGHFYFRTDKTTAQFKTWLAEQYAAGTPVMVMFVRSTPTTESVAPQPLTTAEGTNIVDSVANVGPLTAKIEYKKAA